MNFGARVTRVPVLPHRLWQALQHKDVASEPAS